MVREDRETDRDDISEDGRAGSGGAKVDRLRGTGARVCFFNSQILNSSQISVMHIQTATVSC